MMKNTIPTPIPITIKALNLLKKASMSLKKYRGDIVYINKDTADIIKKSAATTKVSLKTSFSTPLLVKDDEFEDLEKPVPRT